MNEGLQTIIDMQKACAQKAESTGKPMFRKENSDGEHYCYISNVHTAENLEGCADRCPFINIEQLVYDTPGGIGGSYHAVCDHENEVPVPVKQPETQPQLQQNP